MEKWFRRCLFLGLVFALTLPNLAVAAAPPAQSNSGGAAVQAADDHHEMDDDCTRSVKLTEKQKKELQKIYEKLMNDSKELVNTYAKFGAITEDQQKHKLKMLESYKQGLQDNNFIGCIEVGDGELEYELRGKSHHHRHWHKKHRNYDDDRYERDDRNEPYDD